MKTNQTDDRQTRLRERALQQIKADVTTECQAIRERQDYLPQLEPFLQRLEQTQHPLDVADSDTDSLVISLCVQAPLELIHAAGLRPVKLSCGSFAAAGVAQHRLPALTCPMIKSIAGILESHQDRDIDPMFLIIPTTCDWVVKFPQLCGIDLDQLFYLELPHLRESEKAACHWLEACFDLKDTLEAKTGRRMKAATLRKSIQTFNHGWTLLNQLIEQRKQGRLAASLFMIVTQAFGLERIETWCDNGQTLLESITDRDVTSVRPRVYLTGSPLSFPNFKLLHLIEEAGMQVCADDLCSSERIFPGGVCYDDPSEHGLMKALAQRYHRACTCPTFADNDRRINKLLHTLNQRHIAAVVIHVLKGCHPYDIESKTLEKRLKQEGIKCITIETDYVEEDRQNLLTRLEAFRSTLGE